MEILWWVLLATAFAAFLTATVFYARYRQALALAQKLEADVAAAMQHLETARHARLEAEKCAVRAEEKMIALRDQIASQQKLQEEMTQAAIVSVADAGRKLSGQLLEDHRNELKEAKKQSEEQTKKVADPLMEQFKTITDTVAALKASDVKQDKVLSTMWRALSTPSAVGQFGELGLENYLRQLHLEPERDFIMQYSITGEDGSRLQPDCVIPLPNNQVIVIDSKASRFVLAVAATTDEEARTQALNNLARTMHDHVKALKAKDYQSAILNMCKKAGRIQEISQVIYVMYLPSETAYFFLHEADRNLIPRTREEHGILIVSPTHLYALLAVAQAEIRQARKAANEQDILEALPKLLDGLATALKSALNVGNSVRSAAKNFEEFAKSFNHSVLGQAGKLHRMGIHHKNEKDLEKRLPRYEILSSDDPLTVEAESTPAALTVVEPEAA